MGYKVNRIGTPHFDQSPTVISTDIAGTWATTRSLPNANATNRMISIDGAVGSEFSTSYGRYNNQSTYTPAEKLCFGQQIQCIQAANGNCALYELKATFDGFLSERFSIAHRAGEIDGTTTAGGSVNFIGYPNILKHQIRRGSGVGQQWTQFESLAVFLWTPSNIRLDLGYFGHCVEIRDTETAAGPLIANISVKLSMRSIDTSETLFPFDVTR